MDQIKEIEQRIIMKYDINYSEFEYSLTIEYEDDK